MRFLKCTLSTFRCSFLLLFLHETVCNTHWPWQSLWCFYQREWKLPVLKEYKEGGKTDTQVKYHAIGLKPDLRDIVMEPKQAEQVRYHWARPTVPPMLCWLGSSHLFTHIPALSERVKMFAGNWANPVGLTYHFKHWLLDEQINAKTLEAAHPPSRSFQWRKLVKSSSHSSLTCLNQCPNALEVINHPTLYKRKMEPRRNLELLNVLSLLFFKQWQQ